jgi:hypothetical protein
MSGTLRALVRCASFALALAIAASANVFVPSRARAQAQEQVALARVIVERTAVYSGPGAGFRRVHTAQRGDAFRIRGRASRGYWLRIELADGRQGFVLGDAVHTYTVSEEEAPDTRFLPWLLSPSGLPLAHGEIALIGGALGSGGLFGGRVSYLFDPAFGMELSSGIAVARSGRLVLATVGPVVNLFPSSPLGLLATVQAGITASSPNADTFLLARGSIATLTAGVGFRLSLRYGLTLRVEARAHTFIEPDRYITREEISGGLAVFF